MDNAERASRVRICKIFTDLPVEPDKPIEFGVTEFCRECRLCAEYCEASAISLDDEPSFEVVCRFRKMLPLLVRKWHRLFDMHKGYRYNVASVE